MPDASTIIVCPNCGRRNRVRPSDSGFPRCSVCHTVLPWIVQATAETFEAELRSSLPVLVDFWAPWCGPCRMLSPLVERAGQENAGRLKVVKLNVDEAPALSKRYGVQGIPLLVLFRDGTELARVVGALPRERLNEWLGQQLQSAGKRA